MKIKFKILDILFICIIINLFPVALLGLFNIPENIYKRIICYSLYNSNNIIIFKFKNKHYKSA